MYALLVLLKFGAAYLRALWAAVLGNLRIGTFAHISSIDVRTFFWLEVPILGLVK